MFEWSHRWGGPKAPDPEPVPAGKVAWVAATLVVCFAAVILGTSGSDLTGGSLTFSTFGSAVLAGVVSAYAARKDPVILRGLRLFVAGATILAASFVIRAGFNAQDRADTNASEIQRLEQRFDVMSTRTEEQMRRRRISIGRLKHRLELAEQQIGRSRATPP